MTSNTNNKSDQVDVQLYDEPYKELLYEVLLYKKKDIITIQKNSICSQTWERDLLRVEIK